MPSKLGKKHPKYQPPKICHKSEIGPGYKFIQPPAIYIPKAMRIITIDTILLNTPSDRGTARFNLKLTKNNPPAGFSGITTNWPNYHCSASVNLVAGGPNWHIQFSIQDAANLITIWTRPDQPYDFRKPFVIVNDGKWTKIQDQGNMVLGTFTLAQA